MTTDARISGAPISWGVCEAPDWGVQLGPDLVLAELAQAGYSATETGPDGWLPGDSGALRDVLGEHGLDLAGAFVPVTLTSRAARNLAMVAFDHVLDRIAAFPGVSINLAVQGASDDYDGRVVLDTNEWASTLVGLDELVSRAAERGVTCALHPHAGTAVERGEDLERVLEGSRVDLCLDTGHLVLGGVDPVDVVRAAGARVRHVHLKDVDAELAERWRAGAFEGMRAAVDAGIWRALGSGDARVEDVIQLLVEAGYDGWYVLERDTSIDPDHDSTAVDRVADAARERTWVESRLGAEVAR